MAASDGRNATRAPAPAGWFARSFDRDARVEPRIGDVEQQGNHHDDGGEQQDEALDQRIVAVVDGLQRQPTKTVPAEYVLDYDGATHEVTENHGDDRDHA